MSDDRGARQKCCWSDSSVGLLDVTGPQEIARIEWEQIPSIQIIDEGECAGTLPALTLPEAQVPDAGQTDRAAPAQAAATAAAQAPATAPATAPIVEYPPPAASPAEVAPAALSAAVLTTGVVNSGLEANYDAMQSANLTGEASQRSGRKAYGALDALYSGSPAEFEMFSGMFSVELARLEREAFTEVALMLGGLRNSPAKRVARCCTQLAEDDDLVFRAIYDLSRLQEAPRATVATCREQFSPEERAWRRQDPGRQSPLGKARAKAEKTYWTSGSSEWYMRTAEWAAALARPPGLGFASRAEPVASGEQAAARAPTMTEPCEPVAGRRLGSAAPPRQAAEPAKGQGVRRGAHGAEKNSEREAWAAEHRRLRERTKGDMLREMRKVRGGWEDPEAAVYEQLAVEMRLKGASGPELLAATAAVHKGIREWERSEFVASYSGRGSATTSLVNVDTLDGGTAGTAGTASGGLGGDTAATAGGNAAGTVLEAGALRGNAVERGAREQGGGAQEDAAPGRRRAPALKLPSGVALGKRTRQHQVQDAEEPQKPED